MMLNLKLKYLLSFRKNLNFLMSTTYMFNLMFASILIVTLVALGKYSMARARFGYKFWLTITQIFSSNMRYNCI